MQTTIDEHSTSSANSSDALVSPSNRWSNPKSLWDWYNSHPFLVGFNYLPRTAVNFLDMWLEESFNPDIIDEELSWARNLGYNTLRTNLPMILYENDCEGLTKRINTFLDIANKNGMSVMLCPMDDCEFSGEAAILGPQPAPKEGVHNSRAIASPGRSIVLDKTQWYRVEAYIRYVVRTWGGDPRVFIFDLYNEPGNAWVFENNGTRVIPEVTEFEENALKLMEKVFTWAREESPMQPLTTSAWHVPDPFFEVPGGGVPLAHPIDQRAMQLSDVVTIHAYCDANMLRSILRRASIMGKPIILTEWMARHVGSTFEKLLPVMEEFNVGSYQWGLVQGKTQTNLAWPHVAQNFVGNPLWFHDVFNQDGTPHVESEAEFLKKFTAEVKTRTTSRTTRKHRKTFSYLDLAQGSNVATKKKAIPSFASNRHFSMDASSFADLLVLTAVNTALQQKQIEINTPQEQRTDIPLTGVTVDPASPWM